MKTQNKVWLIAITVLFAFAAAACKGDNSPAGGSGSLIDIPGLGDIPGIGDIGIGNVSNGNLGPSVTFNALQVKTPRSEGDYFDLVDFTGNLELEPELGYLTTSNWETGAVINGKLIAAFHTPAANERIDSDTFLGWFRNAIYAKDDPVTSNKNAEYVWFRRFEVENRNGFLDRNAEYMTSYGAFIDCYIEYIWVSEDVTFGVAGFSEVGWTVDDISLSLKRGWNAISNIDYSADGTDGREIWFVGELRDVPWVLYKWIPAMYRKAGTTGSDRKRISKTVHLDYF